MECFESELIYKSALHSEEETEMYYLKHIWGLLKERNNMQGIRTDLDCL